MDRKALRNEYRERAVPMGVYRVACTVTGNAIVAASKDLNAILNRHRAQLRLNAHNSAQLMADWRAHGSDSFTFEILDTLTPPPDTPDYDPVADLTALEDLWLDKLSMSPDRLYSISPVRRGRTPPG